MVKKISLLLRLGIGILILILFLIIGGTYAFLSFETIVKLGISFGLSATTLKIIGYSLIGVGIAIFLLTLLTDFLRKVDKIGSKFWYLNGKYCTEEKFNEIIKEKKNG